MATSTFANHGTSERILRANIGMTISDVKQTSTIPVSDSASGFRGGRIAVGQNTFTFEIPGSGVQFGDCRCFWLETADCADPRLKMISIGISGRRIREADLPAAAEEFAGRLTSDGWTPIDAEHHWIKDETLLVLDYRKILERPLEVEQPEPEYMVALKLLSRENRPES